MMESETSKKFVAAEPLVHSEPSDYEIEEMLERMEKEEEIRNRGKPPAGLPF